MRAFCPVWHPPGTRWVRGPQESQPAGDDPVWELRNGRNPTPVAQGFSFVRWGVFGIREQLGHVTSNLCATVFSFTTKNSHSRPVHHAVFSHIKWDECLLASLKSVTSLTHIYNRSNLTISHLDYWGNLLTSLSTLSLVPQFLLIQLWDCF